MSKPPSVIGGIAALLVGISFGFNSNIVKMANANDTPANKPQKQPKKLICVIFAPIKIKEPIQSNTIERMCL